MDMPAFNLKENISMDQLMKLNVDKSVEHANDKQATKTMTQVLNISAVKEAVKKLANE